jgi:hypothetical protein
MLITGQQKRQLGRYYSLGVAGAGWYQQVRSAALQRFGADAHQWLAFFALTSPNATVAANVTLATKALMQWREGRAFEGYLGTVVDSLNHYAQTGNIKGESRKVRAFYANLTGDLVPITVDRWVARAAGAKSNPKNEKEYSAISFAIRELSWRMETEPAMAQAAVWAGVQMDQGIVPQCVPTMIANIPSEVQERLFH